jgi:hypothetical protein
VHEGCENNGLDLEGDHAAHNDETEHKNNNADDPELEWEDLGPTVFDTLTNPVYDADDAPCLSEVLAIMFAWMGRHKATDASAEDVWGMLGMLIPKDHDLPSFNYAKTILEQRLARTMEVIEICPCDKTAYWDFKSAPLQGYNHSHRTRCHRKGCGLSRNVDVKTPHGLRSLPRKVMYYLPLKFWLQNLFRNKALVPHLRHDSSDQPPGAVVHSHGFHEKVINNPHLNDERRNQGLIFMSDGVPYFKDRGSNRKGYPCGVRLANPPEAIGKALNMTHMVCLMSCEYWTADPHTGKPKRVTSAPKSMQLMLLRIADELHHLYFVGIRVVDYSLHQNNVDREFILKCIILLWIGDYPGQGEISGFKYTLLAC